MNPIVSAIPGPSVHYFDADTTVDFFIRFDMIKTNARHIRFDFVLGSELSYICSGCSIHLHHMTLKIDASQEIRTLVFPGQKSM